MRMKKKTRIIYIRAKKEQPNVCPFSHPSVSQRRDVLAGEVISKIDANFIITHHFDFDSTITLASFSQPIALALSKVP